MEPQLTPSLVECELPTFTAIMLPVVSTRSQRSSKPDVVTVKSAADGFLSQRDLRPRCRIVYGYTLGRLCDRAGDTPISKLQVRTVQSVLDAWYGDAAPSTWNLNLAAIRSFIAYAKRQGWLERDPTLGIERRVNRTNPDQRVIPTRDIDALWRDDRIALREKTLWRLLYDTSCRAQEILALDVEDMDLEHKFATVTGKGGGRRAVNWYTHTSHLMPRLLAGRTKGPVFLAERPPRTSVPTADIDPVSGHARLSYRRAAELFTNATGWTLHQLRHTRIRELKDNGCPLPILQKITGHESLRTLTEHYPGPSPDAVRDWYTNTDPAARRRSNV